MYSFIIQLEINNSTVQHNRTDKGTRNYKSCPLYLVIKCLDVKMTSTANQLKLKREKRLCNNCLLPDYNIFSFYNKETKCTVVGFGRKH